MQNATRGPGRHKGFSLIELLIVLAIILVIAAIAIPNLLRSRIAANEASAVSSLRNINTACTMYNTSYGTFPAALSNLQPPGAGGFPTAAAADLIDSSLANATAAATAKSGYYFTYTPGAGNTSYTIEASPVTLNQTGLRYFFTDASGVIRFNVGAVATINSPPLQ